MIKFQYNKIEYLKLERNLKVRKAALPTLKNKEAALRLEVYKRRHLIEKVEERFANIEKQILKFSPLFSELRTGLLKVKSVDLGRKKIAGVMTPIFKDVIFEEKSLLITMSYLWNAEGIKVLKEYIKLASELKVEKLSFKLLEKERRKTTQKVNLYEKVQIPEFQSAIRKIKRYLEDVENLDRASQKMMKKRLYESGRL